MSVAQEQLQAVLGRKKPASGAVAARDFRQPRRLDQETVREHTNTLKNTLPALERRLAEGFGIRAELGVGKLGEVDAETIFTGRAEPLCVLRFGVNKEPAWLVWDSTAAVSAAETIFGAKASAGTARRLSPSEVKVVSALLADIARAVTAALKLAATEFALVQTSAELGSWREGGERAEPHRLEVELAVRRGEQTSALRIYLPGIAGETARKSAPLPAEIPAHLEQIEVELSARLPGCEISLDQLVSLETGDVIPLEARLGDPTELWVEGLSLATARLGSHRGRLAVRIDQLAVRAEDLQ